MPTSRRRTLQVLAAALAEGTVDLGPGSDRRAAEEQLMALPGIGPWTAHLVLLRGLGDPDAFPATDLGIRKAAAQAGLPGDPRGLSAAAEAWRPWRSYATALLWAATDHAAARLPGDRSPAARLRGPSRPARARHTCPTGPDQEM